MSISNLFDTPISNTFGFAKDQIGYVQHMKINQLDASLVALDTVGIGSEVVGLSTIHNLTVDGSFTFSGSTGTLSGQTGATGPPGIVYYAGQTGDTGDIGATGAIGETGATGSVGATGMPGSASGTGSTGSIGATGDVGPTGSIGPTGGIGPTGSTGHIGVTGAIGATGPIGSTGGIGATGATGKIGPTGPSTLSTNITSILHFSSGTNDMNASGATGTMLIDSVSIPGTTFSGAVVAPFNLRVMGIQAITSANSGASGINWSVCKNGVSQSFWHVPQSTLTLYGVSNIVFSHGDIIQLKYQCGSSMTGLASLTITPE